LPLRAGELVRAVFLGQREKIAIPAVVGTILLEKLFDFLAIGVLLIVLVLRATVPPTVQVGGLSIAAVIIAGFGFVVALAVWRTPTLNLVGLVERRLPFNLGERLHLQAAARNFAERTDSLREPRLWLVLLGWTAVTWVFGIGSTLAGARALSEQPTLEAVLLVVVATSTVQAVPSSPGYVGVYHLAAAKALTAFGLDDATALSIALVTHAFSYGSLVVVGMIALWTGGYTFGDLLKGTRSRSAVGSAPVSADL
jgi:uncharacterized protein (TIRG00374 family)